jgi:signal transduction histidine kinase
MGKGFNLSITQHFLVFFFITALLPMVFISTLLFESIDNKFTERIARMLDIGGLFAAEVYESDLEKLALSIDQAADITLYREYQIALAANNLLFLQENLNKFKALHDLNHVAVYSPSGKLMLSSNWTEEFSHDSYRALIKDALLGKSNHSTERFQLPDGSVELEYIAAAPIRISRNRIAGVLMATKPISRNFSFQELVKIFPGLDMRIYTQSSKPAFYILAYSSFSNSPILMSAREITRYKNFPPRILLPDDTLNSVLDEKLVDKTFKSKALVLKDHLSRPIAYLIVSTSEEDLKDIKAKNIIYFLIYLLFGFGIAGLAGTWFKRKLINPFNALYRASEDVAQGKLETQVSENSDQYEIQRTLSSFNKMLKQLHEDEKLRGTFVSTLTHDLRTPLIAQKRVLKMYDKFGNELPVEMQQMNKQLLTNNENLLEMVSRLLESYQYEAGKIILMPEYFSIYRLVQECCDEFNPLAMEKNISLIVDVPSDLPEIYADRHQLKRVFQNLIGNALENIDENKKVLIKAKSMEDNVFHFEVTDNGPGIGEELQPHLFSRYYTGNRLRQKIGSGLGLYICRMIVELHGGKIGVESKLGQGTTILFDIPQEPSSAEEPGNEE